MHHWGDIRARLEVAVETVLEKAERLRQVRQQRSSYEETRQPNDSRVFIECSKAKPRDVSSF